MNSLQVPTLSGWWGAVGLCLLVFVGGATGTAHSISSRTLIAPTGVAGDNFGYSVSGAGDVNGDGYEDVIIGALFNDAEGTDAGRAYVYYGGPGSDAVADLILTGAAAGDNFGYSVSGAGDVNGDGYADVIVGANANDAGGTTAGRAYVYYGGPAADNVADLTLTGAAAGDQFGYSVSGAGDVNGDGYGDVIVGAPYHDFLATDVGWAYVYYGGPGADAVADLILTGQGGFDLFGASVSDAGDVNGDGYADVIVGAFFSDGGGGDAGQAQIYFGGPEEDAISDMILTGAAATNYFGLSVSAAGDVNGDGYGDVIVGAYGNDTGGTDAGRAYVYYGGSGTPDGLADLTLTGAQVFAYFGYSVSGAGDVNGDGYADVIVGAYAYDTATDGDAGRAYVYYGGPGADAVADLTWTGAAPGNWFGYSVSGAGDVNGDGHGDVIVGAYPNDAGGVNAGRAFVITIYPYQVLSPNGGEQWVAGSAATVRWRGHDPADLNLSTDGGATWTLLRAGVGGLEENELTIIAPAPATDLARVRLTYSGAASTRLNSDASDGVFRIVSPVVPKPVAHRLQRTLPGAQDNLGNSVSGAGDVNGDGYADVIVGAPYNGAGGAQAGRAYVYHGGPGADAVPDLTLTGVAAGDLFGSSVSGAGDVNGDGYGDVIVGAPTFGAGDAGRAYVFYGGPGADALADLTLVAEANGDAFGVSVSDAGDVNGDGYVDVIVGAIWNDAGGADAGRAYVYFGGPGVDAEADLTLTGAAAGDRFGASVSDAGDMNGDGYGDVIVGAYLNAAGGMDAGRAYIYYGGPVADAVADVTLTGAAPFDNFGISVSGAGDVNGDGYGDVIVGAYQNDAAGESAGRAYVYYGGPVADAVADVTLTGAAAAVTAVYDYFGQSVAGAGDVNGDGYGDVIVGAPGTDAGGVGAGRAYVYYGSPGADEVADVILTGTGMFDQFGQSVAGAGDMNGDGYGDLIVGASATGAYIYDFNRYFVLSPNGGETWNVGSTKTISWLGAEPADVWLSADGGDGDELLAARAGAQASNAITVRVPHLPTKFARIVIRPSDASTGGTDASDSLFTIQTNVALLSLLASPLPQGGIELTWATEPGPEDLRGYRIERGDGGRSWRTIMPLVAEARYVDSSGGPGSSYRLYAVNGFGEELLLGEAAARSAALLSAWPLPYRGGPLHISFATSGGLGGGSGKADLAIYDVSGRLVRRIASGEYAAGQQLATWDGRNGRGGEVASGIYFLRSSSGGEVRTFRLSVLR